jgi:hypothetical protein
MSCWLILRYHNPNPGDLIILEKRIMRVFVSSMKIWLLREFPIDALFLFISNFHGSTTNFAQKHWNLLHDGELLLMHMDDVRWMKVE